MTLNHITTQFEVNAARKAVEQHKASCPACQEKKNGDLCPEGWRLQDAVGEIDIRRKQSEKFSN